MSSWPVRSARTEVKYRAQSTVHPRGIYDYRRREGPPSSIAQQPISMGTALRFGSQIPDATESALQGVPKMIEQQKGRAWKLWEERKSEGSLDPTRFVESTHMADMDESVKHDLRCGRVPPIFHAVVSKGEPLFSTPVHKLSPHPVSAGSAQKAASEVRLVRDSNLFHTFFSDDLRVAISEILDDTTSRAWKFDEKATDTVTNLINTKADMLGADVETTDGLKSFLFVDPSAQTSSLLTRSLSRGVVANCFDSSKRGSSLAITGSEGIGKSWTLLYALQQAMLYENACVAFMLDKQQIAFLCVRLHNRVYVWCACTGGRCMVHLFNREDVLVLLDPKEAGKGGADFAQGARMLIYAAYNNVAHFDNGVLKVQPDAERFLGLWTKNELSVALPKLNPCASLEMALAQTTKVGMIPQCIMHHCFYSNRKHQLQRALYWMTNDRNEMKGIVMFDGKTEKNPSVANPGIIFAVGAGLMANEGEEEFNDSIPPDVGYEGQFVKYTKQVLSFMTDQIATEVIKCLDREQILQLWSHTCKLGGALNMRCAVVDLFGEDLQTFATNAYNSSRWLQVEGNNIVGPQSQLSNGQYYAWSTEPIAVDRLSHVFHTGTTIGPVQQGSGLIDFVGPGRKVYQITVGTQPRMILRSLVTVLIQAGFLVETAGSLTMATYLVPQEKLQFYWVVPPSIEKTWKEKNPYKPNLKCTNELSTADKIVLQDVLANYVEQYVLVLEK